jgi:hypothetical protein
VFGDDANHIVKWLAHRVQRPEDKINHALVLGGAEGIGKDTLLEPVKEAVGPWNFNEVSPQQMLGQFNGYVSAPEDAELADTLDLLGRPEVTTLEHIKRVAPSEFALWLGDRKNARRIPHRLEACGYVPVRNPGCQGRAMEDRRYTTAGLRPGLNCPCVTASPQHPG